MLVGLGHLDLVCSDVERSLAFYRGGLRRARARGPGAVPGRARRDDPLPALPEGRVGLDRSAPGAEGAGVRALRGRAPPFRARGRARRRRRARPRGGASRPGPRSCTHRGSGRSTTATTTRRSSSTPTASGSRSPRAGTPAWARRRSDPSGEPRRDPSGGSHRRVRFAGSTRPNGTRGRFGLDNRGTHVPPYGLDMAAETGTQAIDRAAELLVSVVESNAAARGR